MGLFEDLWWQCFCLQNYAGGRWATGTSTRVLVAIAGCSHEKWVGAQEVGELLNYIGGCWAEGWLERPTGEQNTA